MDFNRYLWKRHRQIDELTDQWTDGPSYRDIRMHIVCLEYLNIHLFAQKYRFSLILTKASRTDGRTDGQTDGRTDGPTKCHIESLARD